MTFYWLWDFPHKSKNEIRAILKRADDPRFDIYAEKLLARTKDPKMAFTLMDQEVFRQKWPALRKRIRKDAWAKRSVAFWQTIYENLAAPSRRLDVARQIKKTRIQKGLNQRDAAYKLGVVQQYISKVENGKENLSIDALDRIAKAFHKKLIIKLT